MTSKGLIPCSANMLSAEACCCSSAVAVTVSDPWQQLMRRQVRCEPHATTRWLPHAAARLMELPAAADTQQPHTNIGQVVL
jgi:hypothetical protein